MASAQVLQLAHPPLWSMDQWPKFASCALGRGAKGGCPFKKLLTQCVRNRPGKKGQRATPSNGQEGGKKTEGEKAFL